MQNSRALAGAGIEIDELLVESGLVNQPRLAADERHRRVVGMRRKLHARFLLRDRNHLLEKAAEPAPEFLGRDRWQGARGRVLVINHIPDHSLGHGRIVRALHADRNGIAARIIALGAARHAGDRKIVAHDRDPRLSEAPEDGLYVLDLLRAPGAVEQHIVPVGRVEILHRSSRSTSFSGPLPRLPAAAPPARRGTRAARDRRPAPSRNRCP